MEELKKIEIGLVPVYETSTGEKVVYGTELYTVLQTKSNYREWVKRRLKDVDAMENEDYDTVETSTLAGGTPKKEHIIKLDIAKEMAMLERNEKGKQVRRYFIQLEKKYKAVQKIVAKQMQDTAQFIEQQLKFNQMVMDKLENKPVAQKIDRQSINHEYTLDEIVIIEERKKELYGLTAKVAKLCEVPQTSLLHQAYVALERKLDIVLDNYKLVYCSETGKQDASMIEIIAAHDWIYEKAIELCEYVIEKKSIFD